MSKKTKKIISNILIALTIIDIVVLLAMMFCGFKVPPSHYIILNGLLTFTMSYYAGKWF